VIREVVANAVMHRDYRVNGSIQIIRYSNRLEVRNPGYSLKAEERLGQPGSETRNPKIAAVLHDVNFAETKGSGIRVMRQLMDEQGLSSPVLQSDRTGNNFMAMLLFHHFLSQDDIAWLKSFDQNSLTEDEMKAMISARELGAIDNSTYRTINREIDTLAASKHLRKLCDCGLLVKKGSGPATYYEPTERALENWPPGGADSKKSTVHDPKKQELDGKKQELDGKKQELDGKKQELDGKKQELDSEKQELPGRLAERIAAQGRKGDKTAVLGLVVELLTAREMSTSELAAYLDRDIDYVRRTYIKPLVDMGKIRSSNPANPTDPGLTYRAIPSSEPKNGSQEPS
jgi:ATP-dependent DNA helicase RecG